MNAVLQANISSAHSNRKRAKSYSITAYSIATGVGAGDRRNPETVRRNDARCRDTHSRIYQPQCSTG
ncbi:hypothetical protein BC2230_40422 [Burkholderia cepacia]